MMFYVQAQFYFCNIKEITKHAVGGLGGGYFNLYSEVGF